jgi:hypothetical protein
VMPVQIARIVAVHRQNPWCLLCSGAQCQNYRA